MTNTETTIRPYLDTVTGDIRCWQLVRGDVVIADGIATRQDAEDRARAGDRVTGAGMDVFAAAVTATGSTNPTNAAVRRELRRR
jgi:hypothetical protein